MAIQDLVTELAWAHGLDAVGVVSGDVLAGSPDLPFFRFWVDQGFHAGLAYLTGERAAIRAELNRLLPGTRSVLCFALNYNAGVPYSTEVPETTCAWISRYAWGDDYHAVLRERLQAVVAGLRESVAQPFEARVCVDTSPVLERALARHTAVGWMGKNTCLINQKLGSWLFLGEVLTTLDVLPDVPAADRCGTCTRCLEACPTQAILAPRVLDSRRCISYWTIEERGAIPQEMRSGLGRHVFGCDICQDVCPWNRKSPRTADAAFQPRAGLLHPPLDELARITEEQFLGLFRNSPVSRVKYRGFLRNVCVVMGNSGEPRFIPELERLSAHPDPLIHEHACWALQQLRSRDACAVV